MYFSGSSLHFIFWFQFFLFEAPLTHKKTHVLALFSWCIGILSVHIYDTLPLRFALKKPSNTDHKNTKMTHSRSRPSTLTYLNYSNTKLTSLFSDVEHLNWAMLLQSAAPEHPDHRFDILVADPIVTLCSRSGKNTVQYANGHSKTNTEDPFLFLNEYLKKHLPPLPCIAPWPFIGGAVGFFGYDLARQLEPLPECALADIDLEDMAIGLFDWAIMADHKEKKLVLLQPEGDDRLSWLKMQRRSKKVAVPFELKTPWKSNMSKKDYHEKFNHVQEHIKAGNCYQINLAQRFEAEYQGNEWEAFQTLSKANAAPFSAFIRLEHACILSFSPERFLQLNDQNEIQTKPIKGTRPRSLDPKIDAENRHQLQHTEKDRAENLMIVDLLRNDIGRVAIAGTVRVPALFQVESFPAVHHLISTVTGTLPDEKKATDLLRACFPGGSITGAPKIRAMQIIEQLEPHRRSLYCGSIGYISRCKKMDTSITIRTLICQNNTVYAWAGGGLVADSQMSLEYQETLDKLSKILPTL